MSAHLQLVAQTVAGGWTPPLPDPRWTTDPSFSEAVAALALDLQLTVWELEDMLQPTRAALAELVALLEPLREAA